MRFLNLQSLVFLCSSLIASTIAAGSAGCGKPLPKAQTPPGGLSHQTDFTTSEGKPRTYLVHIPSNYDSNTPVPLIFSFHGHGKNSSQQEALSQFSNEDWNPNGIAVYPQGVGDAWQGDPDVNDSVNDIGFVNDMIDHFNDRYCIDTTRIYAAGKSNGGGLTGLLACNGTLSTRIAAFAPVSAALYIPNSNEKDCAPRTVQIECSPGRNPVPIIQFHGGADQVIHYSGGGRRGECLPSIPHYVREWSKREGFGLKNKTTPSFNNHVQKYEYAQDVGLLGIITHYYIDDLGHAWPSIAPNGDNPNGTYLDATPVIMDFFNKYTL